MRKDKEKRENFIIVRQEKSSRVIIILSISLKGAVTLKSQITGLMNHPRHFSALLNPARVFER